MISWLYGKMLQWFRQDAFVGMKYYDWANRPAILVGESYAFAVLDVTKGWEQLSWPSTVEVMRGGTQLDPLYFRELDPNLPPLPEVKPD